MEPEVQKSRTKKKRGSPQSIEQAGASFEEVQKLLKENQKLSIAKACKQAGISRYHYYSILNKSKPKEKKEIGYQQITVENRGRFSGQAMVVLGTPEQIKSILGGL